MRVIYSSIRRIAQRAYMYTPGYRRAKELACQTRPQRIYEYRRNFVFKHVGKFIGSKPRQELIMEISGSKGSKERFSITGQSLAIYVRKCEPAPSILGHYNTLTGCYKIVRNRVSSIKGHQGSGLIGEFPKEATIINNLYRLIRESMSRPKQAT